MPITFRCSNPACGATHTVSDELAGKRVKCRQCGHATTVPSTEGGAGETVRSAADPAPASRGATPVPRRIGRFEVVRRLGMGSFGAVYLARDPQLDRDVALKVPRPGTLDDPQVKERFLREAKAAARLQHPYIVPVYDAGEDRGQHYIAAAYVQGRPLNDVIDGKPRDPRVAAEIVRKLAEALHYAHTQGVVHRDVKPHNVMMDEVRSSGIRSPAFRRSSSAPGENRDAPHGDPHLMDFGLARLEQTSGQLTQDGAIIGSPSYMSPEQATGVADRVTPASDQYSLGIVLYELLTGRVPFDGPPIVVLSLVQTQPIEPPSKHVPQIPRDLETICLKAAAKEASARYATCEEFAEDLEHWLKGEPITARRTGSVERLVRWCRREPLTAGLVAAVAIAIAVGAAVSATFGVIASRRAHELRTALNTTQSEKTRADESAAEAQRNATAAQEASSAAAARAVELAESEQAARKEQQLAHRNYYIAQMRLAKRDWENASIDDLCERLKRTQPEWTGGEDLRGFEWHYWDRQCHLELATFTHDREAITAAAFSPDGCRIMTGGSHGRLFIRDIRTGKSALVRQAQDGKITSVSFSPDGHRIVTAHGAGAKIWDLATGQELFALPGNRGTNDAQFSPDGSRVVTGNNDGIARIWDARSGKQILSFRGHNIASVIKVSFSPDGGRVVTAGGDVHPLHDVCNAVSKIWDVTTGRELLELRDHDEPYRFGTVSGAEFSRDGKILATTGLDGSVRLRDAGSGKLLHLLTGHRGATSSTSFSPDGKYIATGSYDGTAKLWSVASGEEVLTLRGHRSSVTKVSFSPNGRLVLSCSSDGSVKIWDIYSQLNSHQPWNRTAGTRTLAISPDGRRILTTVFGHNSMELWDIRGGRRLASFDGHTARVTVADFSPDGSRILSGSEDQTARVWDSDSGTNLLTLQGHEKTVNSARFSLDGQRIVSGSEDRTAKVWDAHSGAMLGTLRGHTNGVTQAWFSGDNSHVITTTDEIVVKVWNATSHGLDSSFESVGRGRVLAFSPEQSLIAVAHATQHRALDNPSGGAIQQHSIYSIAIWNIAASKEVAQLGEQYHGIPTVVFDAKGHRMATSSRGSLKLWDCGTGQEIFQLNLSGSIHRFTNDNFQILLTDQIVDARPWVPKIATDIEAIGAVKMLEQTHRTTASLRKAISEDASLSDAVRGVADGIAESWQFIPPKTVLYELVAPPKPDSAGVYNNVFNVRSLHKSIGTTVKIRITGDTGSAYRVIGTNIFSADSALPAAAVFAGVVRPEETAVVTVRVLPGEFKYEGGVRNGVTSQAWGTSPMSFEFVRETKPSP